MAVFLERSNLIAGDLNTERLPQRAFKPLAVNLAASPDLLHTMDELAELRMPFPARMPQPGRSLYALTDPDRPSEIDGLKMKGALGVKYQKEIEKFIWCHPEPLHPYGSKPQLHISITSDLRVEIKESKLKAMYCLPAEQALTEFECQVRLAKAGIGLKGLAAGEFINKSTGVNECDFLNRPTGVVFIEHRDGLEPLTRQLVFLATDLPNGEVFLMLPGGKQYIDKKLVISQTLKDLVLIEMVGEVKARAAVEAGIARHSAQPDNFWYSNGQILVTDTDSCLIYDEMNPLMKGPQLLRDAASDMLHCLTTVSYFAYSKPYREGIEKGKLRPFHAFMRGFFGKYTEPGEIEDGSAKLQKKYIEFMKENRSELFTISEYFRQGMLSGEFKYPPNAISDTWNRQHLSLLTEILSVFYMQIKNSSLPSRGFSLAELEKKQVRRQFKEGIDNYIAAIKARVLASQDE